MEARKVFLCGMVLLLLAVLSGCGSLGSVSQEDAQLKEELKLLQEELALSEEKLTASVASAQELMDQLQEKMQVFEYSNEDLEKYVNEIAISKDQTIGVMRVRAEEYEQMMDNREEELVNKVDLALNTIQYEFKEFQKELETLRSEFTTFVQDKERLLDLKFLGTYDSLQSEMEERFDMMENTIKAISSQLSDSMEEFASLKNAMSTFVNK